MSLKIEEIHLGEGSFHAITCYDDAVSLVSAPTLKKLSGKTALHHTWRCHHHTGADVVEVVHALEDKFIQIRCFFWTMKLVFHTEPVDFNFEELIDFEDAHLEIADMLEDKRVVNIDGLADLVIHGIHVGLVHSHALLSQGGGIVDRNVMEFRVILPIFI